MKTLLQCARVVLDQLAEGPGGPLYDRIKENYSSFGHFMRNILLVAALRAFGCITRLVISFDVIYHKVGFNYSNFLPQRTQLRGFRCTGSYFDENLTRISHNLRSKQRLEKRRTSFEKTKLRPGSKSTATRAGCQLSRMRANLKFKKSKRSKSR